MWKEYKLDFDPNIEFYKFEKNFRNLKNMFDHDWIMFKF